MSNLTSTDDFVFNINEEGKILSSGFLVNSFLLHSGMSPMLTINLEQSGGEYNKFSQHFDNLAVPAGLFYINCPNKHKQEDITNKHNVINDDIYEKLFQLILSDKQKKKIKTKKNINKITNHTKTKKK
jgi:hypothetical protein